MSGPATQAFLPAAAGATMPRWGRLHWYLIAAVFGFAYAFGLWYAGAYRASGGVPSFYQEEFGPAVMLACGRGFSNVDVRDAPDLDAFLSLRRDTVRCEDIPRGVRIARLNGFQRASRNLMGAAAWVWRVTGVRWAALDYLAALFFAVTITAAYAVMSLLCGRALALLTSATWALSPRHLANVPHLRDYSKAPFFALALLATWWAFTERRPLRLAVVGALFGVAQGLGLGMRTDVLLFFVPFFAVLFLGGFDGIAANLGAKISCAVATVAAFVVVASPMLAAPGRTGSFWHVALLGLTAPNDENLSIGFPRPAYSFPYDYNDGYIETVVRAHAIQHERAGSDVRMYTAGYDAACRDYYAALARRFPGDFVVRMMASARYVANLPALLVSGRVARGVGWRWAVRLSEARSWLLERFNGFGAVFLLGAVVVFGLDRLRYAWLAFSLLALMLAYPFLEFEGRHLFHLEFLVLGVVVWAATLAVRWANRVRAGLVPDIGRRSARAVLAAAAPCAVIAVALFAARAVQVRQARALLTEYEQSPVDPLHPTVTPLQGGAVRLGVDLFGPSAVGTVQTAVIVAEFSVERCGSIPLIDATFRYAETDPRRSLDFSRPLTVALSPAGKLPTRVFLPVYAVNRGATGATRFVGVDVPGPVAGCARLARMRDASRLPLLIPAMLTFDWSDRLYERL